MERSESISVSAEHFSSILTYFNVILVAICMGSIIMSELSKAEMAEESGRFNTFIPVKTTSIFMWGGLKNWIIR